MQFVLNHPYLIPLMPLIAAAFVGLFGAKILKGQSHWPIWLGVGASAVMAIMLLVGALSKSEDESAGHGMMSATPATMPAMMSTSTQPATVPATMAAGTQPATTQSSTTQTATGQLAGTQPATTTRQSSATQAVGTTQATATTHPSSAMPEAPTTEAAGEATWFKNYQLFNWISLGKAGGVGPDRPFSVDFGFWMDSLTAVMLTVVCGIGFFITVFAAGYMKGEAGYFRFFAYLGLFIFMMSCLVMGNNLIMLYLGWEGVGLSSYLLIGYYYDKPAAREAAKKAFLVNRIGDFGFALGIMLCFSAFGTVTYFGDHDHLGLLQLAADKSLTEYQAMALQWIPFLLMLGAFGKSAQFPLYVWLPDAMEGPTPVSALIHAATMVTAGVYMIARCGTLFVGNDAALYTIGAIGSFTAIFSATIALRQFDLKKVFAYSTISQLGFMFVGVAVLAPVAAVFHLVTHAFFKALLFLSSGVVMHAMNGILDMREMSGLKRVLPKTRMLMLIGCLALAGCPLLSGFFSKDEIVHAAFSGRGGTWIFGVVLLLAAFLTAYYTFRLYFRVFEGPLKVPAAPSHGHGGHGAHDSEEHKESGDEEHHDADGDDHGHAHNHEPPIMMLPLIVLALGALFAGYINWPAEQLGDFLGESPSFKLAFDVASRNGAGVNAPSFGQPASGMESSPYAVMAISGLIALAGIFLAYAFHLRDRMRAERIANAMPQITRLLEAKYWIDEIYGSLIVEPLRTLGRILWDIDRYVVDGVVAAIGWIPQLGGWVLKLGVQRGSLQGYAAAMLFGVVVILVLVFM